uniref:SRCR domain-containing protein n=1 Tax=Cyclopterus lumpus TaxID=8103 RepID=A0A8C2XHP0_CYCLU
METSVDQKQDGVSFTQSNPLFDMTDLYSFQPEDLKPARPRRQWCFNVIIVFFILQTALNAFLIYKVIKLGSSLSNPRLERLTSNPFGEEGDDHIQTLLYNNSLETKTLRGHLWALKSQVLLLFILDHIPVFFFLGDSGVPGPLGPKGEMGLNGQPGTQGVAGEVGGFPYNYLWNNALVIIKAFLALWVTVRLVPGKARGRVEVNYKGVWGTVCDDGFDTVDGKVICKMLGFQTAIYTFTASPGSGRIWLDELQCLGTESDIFSCRHRGVGVNNCQHNEDAGLHCV